MNKPNNWSILGFIAGAVFALGSFVRYYIFIHDLDKVMAYVAIGILICAVSWLYDQTKKHQNELDAMGDYLQDKKAEEGE